jgi:hypothetical protein
MVIHKRDMKPGDVYIGRPGPWGNPYIIGRDGTRAEVIAKYEQYLKRCHVLMAEIHVLKGKRLACWCSPLECHGDILAHYANR